MKILEKILTRTVKRIVKKSDRKLPENMEMGRGSYFGGDCTFIARDGASIRVGKYCSLANGVALINANHRYQCVSTYPIYSMLCGDKGREEAAREVADIVIGNDVWIGTNAVVLKGVEVGDGAIIGAGAVVTKSIPPYAIAAGNPARVIKYRFSEEEIASLLQIRWWDWPPEKIRENADAFYLPMAEFIKRFG